MKYFATTLLLVTLAAQSNGCVHEKANTKGDSTQANKEATTAGATVAGATSAGETTPGFTSFENAFAKAKTTNKMVLVDVYTDWCVWCKRMDKDTYPDAKVQAELSKYFTAAKLNAESTVGRTYKGEVNTEQQIAAHWGVSGYPTLVFMTSDGEVVQEIPGYVPPAEFPLVLRYLGSGDYLKNKDYQNWKKQQS
jgi:thioredoxin-related protein